MLKVVNGPTIVKKDKLTIVPNMIPELPNWQFFAKKIEIGILIIRPIIAVIICSLVRLIPLRKKEYILFHTLIITKIPINIFRCSPIFTEDPTQILII